MKGCNVENAEGHFARIDEAGGTQKYRFAFIRYACYTDKATSQGVAAIMERPLSRMRLQVDALIKGVSDCSSGVEKRLWLTHV
jgi:hypothetical protein